MRHGSKAYWKQMAQDEAMRCVKSYHNYQDALLKVHRAERELKEQKQTGWRKRAIMQCLVGLSYNEAADLIASVQGNLGCKSGEEIITYSEQS